MTLEPGALGPSHNQYLPSAEQLGRYEGNFAPFAEAAHGMADRIGRFRRDAGLDPYGRQDTYDGFMGEEVCRLVAGTHRLDPETGREEYDEWAKPLEGVQGVKGEGSDKWVAVISGPDGKQYALKGMRLSPYEMGPGEHGSDELEARLNEKLLLSTKPLIIAEGEENMEQLIAVDTERKLMVTTLAPGKMAMDMSPLQVLRGVRRGHVDKLARTGAFMREHGLHPHNAGGVFFDSDAGFFFVDYTIHGREADWNRGGDQTTGSTEELLRFVLADHRKLANLTAAKRMGASIRPEMYQTTGLRAKWRGVLMGYARKLDVQMGTTPPDEPVTK